MQKQYLIKKNWDPVNLGAPLTAAADSSQNRCNLALPRFQEPVKTLARAGMTVPISYP
jgi:hypothetical protein